MTNAVMYSTVGILVVTSDPLTVQKLGLNCRVAKTVFDTRILECILTQHVLPTVISGPLFEICFNYL